MSNFLLFKNQEVKKKHDRLMREQSRHAVQLKSLRNELEQMKKTKVLDNVDDEL